MYEKKHTYCRVCEPNCGLVATLEEGRITKLSGDREHPISKGYACERGMATLDIHHDPDRIRYPLRRTGDGFQRVSWDEALGDIGRRLAEIRKRYGKHSVGMYFGNPVAFDTALSMYLQMAMKSLGSRNIFSAGSQDCNNKFVASEKVLGSPVLQPVPDIDRMDFLLLIGSNPAVSKMSFISLTRSEQRLKAIVKRGGRVIVIDPRRSETAELVGEHHFIRPDTDVFLLASMLRVIISERLYDDATVQRHTRGFAELSSFVDGFTPERVAKVTGMPAGLITQLARDFARAGNACVHSSVGVNMGSFGTVGYWLVHCLNIITGRFDRRGSLIFPEGLIDAARAMRLANRNAPKYTSRIGGYPDVMGTMPAGIMADEILTPGEGQLKALIVVSGNPLMTVPDTAKMRQALGELDLLVFMDLYVNETGGKAHYVLPSTDMYEHWDMAVAGMMFNPQKRYLNYTDAMVKPEGERKDLWVMLHEVLLAAGYHPMGLPALSLVVKPLDFLGKRLGRPQPLSFNPLMMLRGMLLMGGVSWRKLKESPQGLVLGEHRVGRFFKKRILTEDKKAFLAPPECIAQLSRMEEFFRAEADYTGFKLIGQRQRRTHNSWLHNVPSFMERERTNTATIHPEDASRLGGIADGNEIEVASDTGSIRLPARISDEVMPGVIAIPHGWGHNEPSGLNVARAFPGVNVNALTPSGPGTLEPLSGMARLSGIRVTVAKA